MNENIDLCEILKDCPAGTKLYTPLAGDIYLTSINNRVKYAIEVQTSNSYGIFFNGKGRYSTTLKTVECLLFPSKDQRDWSKFKCPKLRFDPNTLKPFDKVLVKTISLCWHAALFSHIDKNTKLFKCSLSAWDKCIPYNDDTKHLVGTKYQAPEYYRYWED